MIQSGLKAEERPYNSINPVLIWCIQALIIRAGICFLIGFCFVEDHMHSHVGRMEDDWAGDMGGQGRRLIET